MKADNHDSFDDEMQDLYLLHMAMEDDKKNRGGGPSGTKKKSSSEYDVDSFAHAEDFYGWDRDDFVDNEEAEEYFESHRK